MPDKNKVLHLVSADCDWESAMRIATLAAALRERGLGSVVTAPGDSRLREFAEAAGVQTTDFELTNSLNPMRWIALSRLIKATNAGVVHVHDAGAAVLLSRTRRLASVPGIVATRYDLRRSPVGAEYHGAGAVVCPSEALAGVFRKIPAAAGKTRVVYDGVNMASADRALEERDNLRAAYRNAYCPKNEKPLFLVNIAPLEDGCGHADLLEAMTEIIAALPQTHLFIMGEGPLRGDLDRQARIMALDKFVDFLEPDKAFSRLLAAADLYVSASRNDVSGFMVQAAMAAGRAAVLAESGCYPELIEAGKSGIFAAGDNAVAFKDAIMDLLENRTQREHFGRMAKARAAKMFDISVQAEAMADIYKNIAGNA